MVSSQTTTSLLVAHVVDLVEYDPGHFTHNLGSTIEHRSENLGSHDETRRGRVDGDVSGHEADITEFCGELAELLIGEGLDGRSVDDTLTVLETLGDGVLGDDSLTGGRMRRHEDRFVPLDAGDRVALEGIERELVLLRWRVVGDVLGEWHIWIVGWKCYLMTHGMGYMHLLLGGICVCSGNAIGGIAISACARICGLGRSEPSLERDSLCGLVGELIGHNGRDRCCLVDGHIELLAFGRARGCFIVIGGSTRLSIAVALRSFRGSACPFCDFDVDASFDFDVEEDELAASLDGAEAAAALVRFLCFFEGEEPGEAAGLDAASAGARKSKRPSGSMMAAVV